MRMHRQIPRLLLIQTMACTLAPLDYAIAPPYIDVLYNTITNNWNSNFDKSDGPSFGKRFRKMHLNGHFISSGDDVAIRHGENSLMPWFGKVIGFICFERVSILGL